MAMVGEWLLYCHMRQKVWVTSLCLAVKYVDAQEFCAMLLRRHPEGIDMRHENMMLLPVSSEKQKASSFSSR